MAHDEAGTDYEKLAPDIASAFQAYRGGVITGYEVSAIRFTLQYLAQRSADGASAAPDLLEAVKATIKTYVNCRSSAMAPFLDETFNALIDARDAEEARRQAHDDSSDAEGRSFRYDGGGPRSAEPVCPDCGGTGIVGDVEEGTDERCAYAGCTAVPEPSAAPTYDYKTPDTGTGTLNAAPDETGADHAPEWEVSFEFVERDNAEAFADDVSGWLCERVKAPRHFEAQAAKELEQKVGEAITCPRYWLYEDASAGLTPIRPERAADGAGADREFCESCRTLLAPDGSGHQAYCGTLKAPDKPTAPAYQPTHECAAGHRFTRLWGYPACPIVGCGEVGRPLRTSSEVSENAAGKTSGVPSQDGIERALVLIRLIREEAVREGGSLARIFAHAQDARDALGPEWHPERAHDDVSGDDLRKHLRREHITAIRMRSQHQGADTHPYSSCEVCVLLGGKAGLYA